jgi:hypothetical protein
MFNAAREPEAKNNCLDSFVRMMHGNGMVDSLFVKEKTLLSDGEIGFSSQF